MSNVEAFGMGTQSIFIVVAWLALFVALICWAATGSPGDDGDTPEDANWLDQLPHSTKGMFWGFAIFILCIVVNATIDALM